MIFDDFQGFSHISSFLHIVLNASKKQIDQNTFILGNLYGSAQFSDEIHEISSLAAKRYLTVTRRVPDVAVNCLFFYSFQHDFYAFVTGRRVKHKNKGKSIF